MASIVLVLCITPAPMNSRIWSFLLKVKILNKFFAGKESVGLADFYRAQGARNTNRRQPTRPNSIKEGLNGTPIPEKAAEEKGK